MESVVTAPPRSRSTAQRRGMRRSATLREIAFDAAPLAVANLALLGMPALSFAIKSAPPTPPHVFRESATGLLRAAQREITIRFHAESSVALRTRTLRQFGFRIARRNRFVPEQLVVQHPDEQVNGAALFQVANEWAQMPHVRFAAPNFVSEFRRTGELPEIPEACWTLRNLGKLKGQKAGQDVHAAEAWKISTGDPQITVAIVDDGVDLQHPNLKRNLWKNGDPKAKDQRGRDFFLPANDAQHYNPSPKEFQNPYNDLAGNDIHGTPCAGIVAAAGLDGGAIGIAPRCRILPVKVFHASRLAADDRVADAIRYAAVNADIVSCSWHGAESPDIEMAIADAARIGRKGLGTAVFASSGNDGVARVMFPARAGGAIAVGAVTDAGRYADYSNTGDQLALVAPSHGGAAAVFTTDVSIPGRGLNPGSAAEGGADGLHTNRFGSTSAATALAAGIGALALSVNPALRAAELRDLLIRTAEKIGAGYDSSGRSKRFGFGRVNAQRALEDAQK